MLHQLLFVLAVVILALVACSSVRYSGCTPVNSAKSQAAMLEDAVNLYVLEIGNCPTTQQGLVALLSPPKDLAEPTKWQGPYLDKTCLPVDPWNNAYHYQTISDKEFRIWSIGPDGVSGTNDDISTP